MKQLVSAILQAIFCLYVGYTKTTDNKDMGGKKFVGTSRPHKPDMGIHWSLDINQTYWYCKDTRHELDNCKQL